MTRWLAIPLMLWVLMIPIITLAQGQKREVEKKIKIADMPEAALSLLEPYLSSATSIKYYKETDIGHDSYECKFILDENRYSIEFDPHGRLEDVEMLVDINDLASKAHDKIITHLQQYQRFRFRRAQLQFSPNVLTEAQLLVRVIQNQNWENPYHEIVVAVKDEKGWSTYEMLFDQDGIFLSQKKVISRQTDNILY
ncbi:MAG: hypothetical protein RIF33_17660 [Cyclobacteriaceae bacterium]